MSVLERALSQYGIRETSGEKNNPEVMKYFKESGFDFVPNDEWAWCSAFVNWCAMKEGYKHSGKLNARSWLDVGVGTATPNIGDVVVLWRKEKDSQWGHVGLFISETKEGIIYVLSGNQNNQVNISPYPKSRLLGYRYLPRVR